MLKQILVSDLRLDMFIQELCGSWMEHPFWRKSFKITDPEDLKRIQESSVREVWIDTAKGLDVLADVDPSHVIRPEENAAEVERTLAQADAPPPKQPKKIQKRITSAEERTRARNTINKSKKAVTLMFQEARMGKALDAANALPLVEEITASVSRNPGALINLARLKTKDDYTYMHSIAVCALMVALAHEMHLSDDEVRQAGLAGLLHDVGKMMIPLDVLNKPGKLTDEEFGVVKNHPVAGYEMLLEGTGVGEVTLDVCLHHHEKMDGSGYPHRLAGEQISPFAKMGAVCDVYDAITSNRPYKAGWSPVESLQKMAEWSKGHFDPLIFQAFVKSVGIYPTGSLVRLESNRLAVVVDQSEKSLLMPIVKVFFSIKSNMRIVPELLNLSKVQDKVVGHESPAQWKINYLDELLD